MDFGCLSFSLFSVSNLVNLRDQRYTIQQLNAKSMKCNESDALHILCLCEWVERCLNWLRGTINTLAIINTTLSNHTYN